MSRYDPDSRRTPSALWLWGLWACAAAAFAAFVVSRYAPAPVDSLLLGVAGAFFIAGGLHQRRVVAYKRATQLPYSTHGPDSLVLQRQAGWSAIVLGAVLIAGAVVGM